jgi:hypothetical protein
VRGGGLGSFTRRLFGRREKETERAVRTLREEKAKEEKAKKQAAEYEQQRAIVLPTRKELKQRENAREKAREEADKRAREEEARDRARQEASYKSTTKAFKEREEATAKLSKAEGELEKAELALGQTRLNSLHNNASRNDIEKAEKTRNEAQALVDKLKEELKNAKGRANKELAEAEPYIKGAANVAMKESANAAEIAKNVEAGFKPFKLPGKKEIIVTDNMNVENKSKFIKDIDTLYDQAEKYKAADENEFERLLFWQTVTPDLKKSLRDQTNIKTKLEVKGGNAKKLEDIIKNIRFYAYAILHLIPGAPNLEREQRKFNMLFDTNDIDKIIEYSDKSLSDLKTYETNLSEYSKYFEKVKSNRISTIKKLQEPLIAIDRLGTALDRASTNAEKEAAYKAQIKRYFDNIKEDLASILAQSQYDRWVQYVFDYRSMIDTLIKNYLPGGYMDDFEDAFSKKYDELSKYTA